MRYKGEIVKLEGGYGFATAEAFKKNVFFHFNELDSSLSPDKLKEGDWLEFDVIKNDKGLSAKNVKKTEKPKDPIIEFFLEHALTFNQDESHYDDFCDFAEKYAYRLKKEKITTSMIRKVYSRVMNASEPMEIKLLRPQFAYLAGRNEGNSVLKEFMDTLDILAKKIKTKEEVNNFRKFMEAIVAYRKYAGDDK